MRRINYPEIDMVGRAKIASSPWIGYATRAAWCRT